MKQKNSKHDKPEEPLTVRDSDALTNIDGFLVTRGGRSRATMSSRLTEEERKRGVQHLLKEKEDHAGAGVYFWTNNQ
jgi:hypothetical protein